MLRRLPQPVPSAQRSNSARFYLAAAWRSQRLPRSRFGIIAQATHMYASKIISEEVAKEPLSRPQLPRSGACAATVCEQSYDLIMFGGYVEEGADLQRQATNETWVFSDSDKRWRLLATRRTPMPRIVSQAVRVGQQLWVVGGWDPSDRETGGILNDVWRLDLQRLEWSQVTPSGPQLQPLSRFQACALGTNIYIHTHRCGETLLVLDTAADPPCIGIVAVQPDPQHGVPSSRGLHSMTEIGGKLFLFGGAPQRGPMLQDLWLLDTHREQLQWERLSTQGATPHPRCSHCAVALGSTLVILGGSYYREDGSGLQPLDDCWALDTSAQPLSWRQLSIQGDMPSARNAAVAGVVRGRVVYHGGWRPFQHTFNDTFVMELATA